MFSSFILRVEKIIENTAYLLFYAVGINIFDGMGQILPYFQGAPIFWGNFF